MSYRIQQSTKLLSFSEFDHLDLFQAQALHYRYARHSHPTYSIGLIEAGLGGNYYRGATHLAPPQSMILMNPEEVHTGYSAEGLPLTYQMLYPSVQLMEQIAGELQGDRFPDFRIPVAQNQSLAEKFASLLHSLECSKDKFTQQCLLIDVLSLIITQHAGIKSRSIQSNQEHQAIGLIKEYLHDQYNTNISLEQLAELTHLNRSYLIRVFSKAVGMPPYTYLTQVRVEKAKELLRQGMSAAETAIAVGMADQSHLNRHFKRIVGVTPGQYRHIYSQQ
ncbi:AraC family transcriptional regulator [Leptolyngbya sp. GB1-A1]|uniref:helix-turn-helix transcriptional regulator n=2 Tax=Leptolyngbya TaxID=47251 RepID=UPI0019ABDDC9|nr:AraC family transcriptional regulator [Cyanobacteria bacterium FACHB-502]